MFVGLHPIFEAAFLTRRQALGHTFFAVCSSAHGHVMPSGLLALHAWLDTWHGLGLIEHGLASQPCIRDDVEETILRFVGCDFGGCCRIFASAWFLGPPSEI
jgi:hypothetical protein